MPHAFPFGAVMRLAVVTLLTFGSAAHASDDNAVESERQDATLSDLMTGSAERNLQSVATECARYDRGYRPDCLRQGLALTWRNLPYHGDYGPMRTAMQQTEGAISQAVAKAADRTVPRLDSKLEANPRFKARRFYTAVGAASLAAVSGQMRTAFDRLQTSLDDLGAQKPGSAAHYTRIKAAIAALARI